jgi:hypothetical protein
MQIRRPIAALMTALALFGGGATLTACGDPAGTDRSDGSTDTGNEGNDQESVNLPNNSDPERDTEDSDDDQQDPD